MEINVDKPFPAAQQQFYAHEAGHSFGAADCAYCGAWVTIMDGTAITAANATAPLPCDQELMWDDEDYGSPTCNAASYGIDGEDDVCVGQDWCVQDQNCEVGCENGCCIPLRQGGGGGGGDGCTYDSDCPGCQGCPDGTCVDEDSYCPYFAIESCSTGGPTCSSGCCIGEDDGGGDGDCSPEYTCGGSPDGCECALDCDCEGNSCYDNKCMSFDPIIVDLSGAGFPLTSAQGGVKFDFFGDGKPIQMAWTAAGANAGWLSLGRNGNGRIDDGAELFTNVTPQASKGPHATNGFNALAAYDLPANGGNGDGVIDQKDAVFSKLLVWVDRNHNGVSDPGELLTMEQAGIQSISLKYAPSEWTDAYGNRFRYRAHIVFSRPLPKTDGYVYDVILTGAK